MSELVDDRLLRDAAVRRPTVLSIFCCSYVRFRATRQNARRGPDTLGSEQTGLPRASRGLLLEVLR